MNNGRKIMVVQIMMLLLRLATANDVGLINTLIYELAEYERLQAFTTEEQLLRDGFGPQPKFRIIIAEWEGQPAGYALFFDCYSSCRGRGIFLEDLFVRSQFRAKKIGKALLARVAATDSSKWQIANEALGDLLTRTFKFAVTVTRLS